MKRLLVVGAIAASAIAPAQARSAGGCSRAVARAAIARIKPHVASLASRPLVVAPRMVDEVICADLTRDLRLDLAVTVASGGTAGDIGWLVLVSTRAGWRLAHSQSGYKVGLFRAGGDLVESQPVYRKNDSNCCPTGGFDHTRWHWNGRRFVVVRAWHTSSYRP